MSYTTGIAGQSARLNQWEYVMERGDGLTTASTWTLADPIHTGSTQVVIPANSFAHQQYQVSSAL